MSLSKRLIQVTYAVALAAVTLVLTTPGEGRGQIRYRPQMLPRNPPPAVITNQFVSYQNNNGQQGQLQLNNQNGQQGQLQVQQFQGQFNSQLQLNFNGQSQLNFNGQFQGPQLQGQLNFNGQFQGLQFQGAQFQGQFQGLQLNFNGQFQGPQLQGQLNFNGQFQFQGQFQFNGQFQLGQNIPGMNKGFNGFASPSVSAPGL